MNLHRYAAHALLALLLLSPAAAEDQRAPAVTFNGFGTLGVAHSNEHQADFRASFIQPEGVGYSHDWSFHLDSRLGLQLTGQLSEKLTAVVQVVVEQDHDHSEEPALEWANLTYAFTPDFSMRAGRIVLPTFLASDTRKVGYANTWVRPPTAVYGLLPVTSSDGIDASYRFRTDSMTGTLQAFHGERKLEFPGDNVWHSNDMFGVFFSMEFGDTLVRTGYQRAAVQSDATNAFFSLFAPFGPEGERIASRYRLDDAPIDLWTIGGSHDTGDWFLAGEWTRTESDTFVGTNTGWYLSGGYRTGAFTPYAVYGQRREQRIDEPGLDIESLPAELRPQAGALNAVLLMLVNANDFDNLALGARWDFRPNYALKLQLDHIRLGEGSYGDLINVQPGFTPGSDFNVFSLNLDFVF